MRPDRSRTVALARGLAAGPVLALALAACGGPAAPSGPAVRDSAGVRIVEYAGEPLPAAALSLSPEPIHAHGSAPGDRLFTHVAVGVLRPDGGAVVADVGSSPGARQQVVALPPGGGSARVLADAGQGPGEVRRVATLTALSDGSVLVEDDGNGRLTVVGDVGVVRSVSTAGSLEVTRGLRVIGVEAGDRPLMTTGSYRSDFPEPWLAGRLVRLDVETLSADTVASYDMAARRTEGSQNPFSHQGIAAVAGARFVHVRTDVPELVWRAPDGAVRQILRWNPEPAYPTDAHLERFRASLRENLARVNPQLGGDELSRFVERQLAELEVPAGATLPFTLTLQGDADGRVWMSEFVPVASRLSFFPDRYHAVGPDGVWLGSLDVPERFRLLDVRGNRVLGVQVDALDVQSVVVYELVVEPVQG